MDGDVSKWMRKARAIMKPAGGMRRQRFTGGVLNAEPLHQEAPLRLAEVLLAQGRLGEAIPVLEAAAQRLPEDAEIHRALGDTLHLRGDRNAHDRCLPTSCPVRPDSRGRLVGAWLRAGGARRSRGRGGQLSPLDRTQARSRPGLA